MNNSYFNLSSSRLKFIFDDCRCIDTKLISMGLLRLFGNSFDRKRQKKIKSSLCRWQRMGDLIGSGFEPHTSRTRSKRLTLVLSGRLYFR